MTGFPWRPRPVVRYYRGVFDRIECWRRTRRGADRAIKRAQAKFTARELEQYRWTWANFGRP